MLEKTLQQNHFLNKNSPCLVPLNLFINVIGREKNKAH
jgi:hypothetical protein